MDHVKIANAYAGVSKTLAEQDLDGYELLCLANMMQQSAYIQVAYENLQNEEAGQKAWADFLNQNFGGTSE